MTPTCEMVDYAQHKAAGGVKHDDWIFFRSMKEAKRWVALNMLQRAGHIRDLHRQVPFELLVPTPAGVKYKIGAYVADFTYELWRRECDRWDAIVEDVKPSGGLREDTFKWKQKHVEAQYGITLTIV